MRDLLVRARGNVCEVSSARGHAVINKAPGYRPQLWSPDLPGE